VYPAVALGRGSHIPSPIDIDADSFNISAELLQSPGEHVSGNDGDLDNIQTI